uniref:Retrovirus-related Pol polyprotein from transposon TNT 1-94 n=1 Tax=Tanacetum cinerariifolium TaxID=118510 RepID=A0A6L2JGP4_TANCI|nr:retrovirus-related Pol polyprotein from transposon TNT 1-94 [Tanacetum cinerariifolium]
MEEEMSSLKKNHSWELVDQPPGQKLISCKWLYKMKEGIEGVQKPRYKERLVARGFTQRAGIDYNEVFSPVVRHTSIRVILSLTACEDYELEQLDVTTSFFHGNLEETIYMRQPPGFEEGTGSKVCLLKKSLYGLKQSPRQWYKRFDVYMISKGLSCNNYDSSVYFKEFAPGMYIYLLLYVDDMLIACKCKSEIEYTKGLLQKEFDMKQLGPARKILGIEIVRDRGSQTLKVSQSGYVQKILNNYRVENGKSVYVPLGAHFKVSLKDCPSNDWDVERMSKVPYANAVGSLMYLMVCTRPDISYAVSIVSKYLANPGKNYWEAVKWILKYLKGTVDVGLVYGRDQEKHVDVKTLTRVEAEYMALTKAVKESIWLKGLLIELEVNLREIVESKEIKVANIGMKDNAVDAFTRYRLKVHLVLDSSRDLAFRDRASRSRADPTLLNDFEIVAKGNGDLPVLDLRTMEELCQPSLNGRGGPISPIAIQATNFGLKNDMIQQVQNSCQFHGLSGDDANKHLEKFLHVTQSIKVNGVTDDALRLYLFPHSLTHHAIAWFDHLLRNSINTFEQMAKMFLGKYFPPSMVTKLRNEITTFVNVSMNRGTFMKRRLKECYDLIENMTANHKDWDTSAQRSESSSSITSSSDTKIAAMKAEMAEINKNLMRSPLAKLRTYMIREPIKFMKMNTASSSGLGTLPGNIITNPKEDLKGITTRSGTAYQGPTIPTTSSFLTSVVERETEATKDTVHPTNNGISAPKPNQRPSISYPSRLHDQKLRDKANDRREKIFQIFKDLNFNISFAGALILMPKFGPTIKTLLTNKDKLSELARTPLNEHCLEVLFKKLPEKLGDPDKFLIPYDFPRMAECLALADLGASINLMPLLVWNKLSLPVLSPTCVTLELADRSISRSVGVAEDVFVKIGRALIDVFEGELTLRVGKEAITFNLDQTSRYSANYNDMTANRIDIIDMACEEYSQEVLSFFDMITSGNHTPYYDPIVSTSSPTLTPFEDSDFLLEEVDAFLALKDDLTSPKVDQSYVEVKDLPPHLEYAFLEGDDKLPVIISKDLSVEEKTALITVLKSHKRAIAWKLFDIKAIDPEFCTHKILMEEDFKLAGGFTVVENEENKLIPTRLVTGWRVCIDYRKLNEATRKDFPLPFMDQMLERLAGNGYYCFLDVFGNSFQTCLSHLEKMLKRCEDTNLCLNWEKSHFMVKESIILGHMISKNRIEIDKAKVDMITKLPHPTTVRAVDYLSKWVKEKALPTNDARVVCKFLKNLFARFGTPHAIISDHGTNFCNDQFAKVMLKYGVTHHLATTYHPQTSGQMRIEQYFLMTDYSLWERLARKNELKARCALLMALPDKRQLKFNIHKDSKTLMEAIEKRLRKLISQLEILGESLSQEDINLKFLRSLPTEWRTHTLIWRNKTDLEEQSLNDLFNSLKIYETEVKSSSSASTSTQNIAFVSSQTTDITNEPISAAASVSAASAKIPVSALSNVDTLSNDVIYLFFASQSNSPQLDNDDLKQIDADDLEEIDLKCQMAMLTMRARKGHFARECGSPKDTKRNVVAEPQRRNVPLRYNALVVLRQKFEKEEQERDDLKLKLEKFQTSSKNLSQLLASQTNGKTGLGYNTQVFTSSMFDCDEMFTSETDNSLHASPIYDRYKSREGYHVVPPPYTGTFMPPKPHLVFHDEPDVNETAYIAFNVELSPTKPHKELSHTYRTSVPIIVDWVSDSEDDSEAEIPQNAPSFVQPTEQVKPPRPSVKPVKNSIPAANLKIPIPKPKTHGHSRNRKACFVCKSLTYLIKDLLSKFKLVSLTAARKFTTVVSPNNVTRPRQAKTIVTKPHSPPRTNINRSQSPKPSNFPLKVTTVKAPMGNPQHALKDKGVIDSGCSRHMIGNMFYLSNFEELNGGYVTFGGNPKGGKISGKADENQVLLRVHRENNMYNVDLKSIVPSGDLTCLFAKTTLDESNLWHRRLSHINFKTMNKLVKENHLSLKVKIIITDNGTEFKNNDLNQFCEMKGIKKEFSVPRTPQQNGIDERKNRTLIEAARTMLADSLLPIPFWAEAVNTACVQEQFDVEKSREENVQQYVLFPLWSSGSKNPQNTNDDATFGGKKPEFEGEKPESEVHVSPSSSAQTKKHDDMTKREAKGKSHVKLSTGYRNLSAEFEDISDNSINEVNAADSPVPAVRQISTNSTTTFSVVGPSNIAVSPTHGKSSYMDPSQYPDDPNMPALEDISYSDDEEGVGAKADFTNLETNITMQKVWVLVDLPNGKRAIGTKWVFRNKNDERGIVVRNKARLVAQGHTQEGGIDYEEVFTLVARIEAIRLFLAYASFMGFMVYQMDVKSDFLYGTIEEEVYVCQPPGFEDPDYPEKVYKVVKALYGLHQDPRAWYETLANYFLENGFQWGKIDQTLFIKRQKGDILLVQIYVDDIIFGSNNKDLCKAFEKLMKNKFQMSSMGELTFFLGLQVKQKSDGIFISQDKYVAEILRKFSLTDGKLASTPIDNEKPLLIDPDAYSDSDYAGVSLDRKSTTGDCQFLGCRLISWQCKKQTVVATSSTESDLVRNMGSSTKFYMYPRFLQLMIRAEVGDLSSHTTKYSSPALTQKVFVNMRRVGKGFFGIETPLFEGMLVAQQANDVANEGVAGVDVDDVPTAAEPSIPSPTPTNQPPPPSQELPSTSQDVTAVANEVKIEKDDEIEENADDDELEPGELKEVVEVVTTAKLMIELVTATSATITAATNPITATTITVAPSAARRRKGVVIRDPEETATPSIIIHSEPKSKEKGKRIMRKEKEDNAMMRYQALKRKPQTEAQARLNMMIYLRNMAGFKMDYFKGMSYDEIRLIFEKYFNSNVAFLEKTKEQMEEEDSKALKRASEIQAEKAAKK